MVALEVRETKRWQWGVRNIYVGGARSRVRWRAGETGGEDHEVLVKHGCCDAPFQLPSVIMWGFSLYCCVSHRCCTAETITISAAMSVLRALVMVGAGKTWVLCCTTTIQRSTLCRETAGQTCTSNFPGRDSQQQFEPSVSFSTSISAIFKLCSFSVTINY